MPEELSAFLSEHWPSLALLAAYGLSIVARWTPWAWDDNLVGAIIRLLPATKGDAKRK